MFLFIQRKNQARVAREQCKTKSLERGQKLYVRNSRRNAKGDYKTWDCKGRKGGGDCRNIILKEDQLLELIENKIGASDEETCAGIEQIVVFKDGRIEIRMRD